MTVSVLIADDHGLVRQGIRLLLEKLDDVQVLGEASNGQDAVDLIRSLKPDIALMDIGMPRLSGIQALEKIREENLSTKVIILSMYYDEGLVQQTLRLGAKGYLLKSSVKEELALAIHAAARGGIYLSPIVSSVVVDRYLENEADQNSASVVLTIREKEILKLIAEGHTNTSIAQALYISVKTVEKHRAALLSKLNAHDTAALVRYAIQYRLIFIE